MRIFKEIVQLVEASFVARRADLLIDCARVQEDQGGQGSLCHQENEREDRRKLQWVCQVTRASRSAMCISGVMDNRQSEIPVEQARRCTTYPKTSFRLRTGAQKSKEIRQRHPSTQNQQTQDIARRRGILGVGVVPPLEEQKPAQGLPRCQKAIIKCS